MASPTRFDRLKFADYTFKQYPKRVTSIDGRRVTVNNAAEEAEATKPSAAAEVPPTPADIAKLESERNDLQAKLAAKSPPVKLKP